MTGCAGKVETTSRLAQWRIDDDFASDYGCRNKSLPFSMGNWNWHIWVEKRSDQRIKLFPEISYNPPIASFNIRVVSCAGDRKIFTHPEVTDKLFEYTSEFIWDIELLCTGKLIIEVEFLDLKTASPNGGTPCSIWAIGASKERPHSTILSSLNRMLSESIHTDITINASNGSIRAHRAVLAARSPVFHSMFAHNLKEKEESTIDIPDMSIETFHAMLDFIYGGGTQHEEFHAHRLALLLAADKYDIDDLKEAVDESLAEDIDAKNVLERLRIASAYQLPNLKSGCLRYLVKFGKIFDIQDDFNEFMKHDDRDLVAEVIHEVLDAWKGF